MSIKSTKSIRTALLASLVAMPTFAFATALITAEEAALPVMKGAVGTPPPSITKITPLQR